MLSLGHCASIITNSSVYVHGLSGIIRKAFDGHIRLCFPLRATPVPLTHKPSLILAFRSALKCYNAVSLLLYAVDPDHHTKRK